MSIKTLTEIEELCGGFIPPYKRRPEEICWDSNRETCIHLAEIDRASPNRILTLIDGEDDLTYAIGGFHYVNRFGFLLMRHPLPNNIDLDSLCVPYVS